MHNKTLEGTAYYLEIILLTKMCKRTVTVNWVDGMNRNMPEIFCYSRIRSKNLKIK